MFARQLGEVRASARLGGQLGGAGFHVRFLLVVIDPKQDVARAHLARRPVLLDVGVVVQPHLVVGEGQAVADGELIDQQEPQPALLRDLVGRLLLRELRRDVLVGRLEALPEVRLAESHHIHPDPLVAAAVLRLHFGIRHADPARDRRLQALEHDLVPNVLLELGRIDRRPLRREQLPVLLFSDEPPVHLERGDRQNPLAHFRVAHLDAEASRFIERRVAVDHLLQHLTVQTERADQLVGDVAAHLQAVLLELLHIELLEVETEDLAVADARQHLVRHSDAARLIHEAGHVQKDKSKDDDRQAPLEPSLVPPHPIEHGHGHILLSGRIRRRGPEGGRRPGRTPAAARRCRVGVESSGGTSPPVRRSDSRTVRRACPGTLPRFAGTPSPAGEDRRHDAVGAVLA